MSQTNPTKAEIDKYAGHYVLHGCQSKAWKIAFPKSKANQKVVHEKASSFHKLKKVQERIVELAVKARDIAEAEFKIDATWVLKQAVEVHNRCMASAKVFSRAGEPVLDDDGNPVYAFQHVGANKSLELIGKHISVNAFSEALKVPEEIVERSFNDFYEEE